MPDSSAVELIFDKFKDKVYRLAFSITRNPSDAEDVTQNTFIKVIKNLKYFRNKSLLSTWIYKIAYNESLMFLRKRRLQSRLSGSIIKELKSADTGLFVNWPKMPDSQLLHNELKERLDQAINRMPIKYRMPLLLDNVEELPQKMSAKVLGLKLNSLKTRLHRAHLLVKSEISDYFKDKGISQEEKNRKCGIWTGFIYKYSKGELNERKRESFRKHIKDCLSCNVFLDMYQKAIAVTKALECRDLPDELKDRIETFLFSKKHKI